MINLSGDLSPIGEYMEMAESFAKNLVSEQTLSTTVRALTRSTAASFNTYVDRVAQADPLSLHHVYEWGHVGDPEFRLWDLISVGHGKTRDLFYQFRASTVPVLTGAYRPEGDTRQNVHVFYWKAAVMESGITLTISPSSDKGVLVFPRSGGGAGDSNMVFTRLPVIEKPGGAKTTGSFLKVWEAFWHGFVNEIVVEDFVNQSTNTLKIELPALVAKLSKSRVKPHTFRIEYAPKVRQSGNAKKAVDNLVNGYLRAARQREAISGGRPTGGI